MRTLVLALALTLAPASASAGGYFLVLLPQFTEQTSLMIPRPYPTREDCRRAARPWLAESVGNDFVCIPAPELRNSAGSPDNRP
jgi:hypothetical protein